MNGTQTKMRTLDNRPKKRSNIELLILQTMLLLLPWVLLEIYPRVTWMDVLFLAAVVIFASGAIRTHKLVRPKQSGQVYGLLLTLWISALLVSGINVRHVALFLFDTTGLIYLAGMSWFFSYQATSLNNLKRLWVALLIGFGGCIGFGAIGVTLGLGGTFSPLFYNNAHKLTATFKYPNQLASFLVLFIPWLWEEVMRSTSVKRKIQYGLWLLLVLIELLSTGSRTGAVAAFVGLALGIGWSFTRGQKRWLLAGGSLLFGALLVALKLHSSLPAIQRSFRGINALFSGQVTDNFRYHNWHLALQIFEQHLLKGYGVANIARDYGYEIHNTYLAVLADTGILGAGAFFLLIGYVTYLAWDNVRRTRCLPRWQSVSRGLFLGLVSELLFASQHLIYRERHLWIWFALVVALHASLQKKR